MKILKLFTFLIWICILGSVLSVPNSPMLESEKKIYKHSAEQSRTWLYGYTYFPWFPYNSCFALAVVLAIPLNLKGRNVYMSYNFETNFYIPYFDQVQGLVPLPFATIDAPAVNQGTKIFYTQGGQVRKLDENGGNVENESNINGTFVENSETLKSTNSTVKPTIVSNVSFKKSNSTISSKKNTKNNKSGKSKKTTKKSRVNRKTVNREILTTLLSRKKFYKMLQHKLELAGFNGEECLLKAICETAEQPLTEHNGVVGDIMHIIFTPTASRDEKLPKRFYDAITDGQAKRCRLYNTLCPKGIFDFITKTIK